MALPVCILMVAARVQVRLETDGSALRKHRVRTGAGWSGAAPRMRSDLW